RFGVFAGEDIYTTKESDRLLRLPMYYELQKDDIDYTVSTIHEFYRNKEGN
ncbi:MAG: dTDP-4-amino-4,6-dideoxygalactose transaminase, partial [Christensenella sp.]